MNRRPWTPQELEALRRLYPDQKAADLARLLGRSVSSVYGAANSLGLGKSAAFRARESQDLARRARTSRATVAAQFQPGQTPWNKGLHYVAGGRSAETRFRPGSKPHTTLPVGSHRLCDGYLQRKIGEARGSNSKRWRGVHELVWIEAHGAVPPGHIVVFKPGQFSNRLEEITLERVECISRAEHARRNHPRSRSPELARLVQLKGAITRQVNRITRENAERENAKAGAADPITPQSSPAPTP